MSWFSRVVPQECFVCCAGFAAALIVIAAVVLLAVVRPPVPPDYTQIPIVDDQPWNELTAQGWQWTQSSQAAAIPPRIEAHADAPISPANVLVMTYDGTDQDSAPVTFWRPLPSATRVYYEFWHYMTPNWECSPAGCGKISFIFPASGGDSYIGVYCREQADADPNTNCPPTGATMVIGGQLQFPNGAGDHYPLGQPIYANKTQTPIYPGRWFHVAVFYQWSSTPTAQDGIWRIWVDGELNLEATDVMFSIEPAIEFQFSPTRQRPPIAPGQQGLFDHTILRADNGVIRRASTVPPPVDRSTPRIPLP